MHNRYSIHKFTFGCLCIIAFGAILNGHSIAFPFGVSEINGGYYFGPFARNWSRIGWSELRGVPLGSYGLQDASFGLPYLNHPPLFAWMSGLGSSEWMIRLPSVIGHVLTGLLLFVIAKPSFGFLRSTIAGIIVVAVPATHVHGNCTYESVVVPAGLATAWLVRWVATCSNPWIPIRAAALLLTGIAGLWLDWAYAFWLGSSAVASDYRNFKQRTLVWALICAAGLIGVATIFVWRSWAVCAPVLKTCSAAQSAALPMSAIIDRPELFEALRQMELTVGIALGWPMVLCSLLCLPFLFWRNWRFGLLLLMPGVINTVVFWKHAVSHEMYWIHFVPLIALSCVSVRSLRLHWCGGLGIAIGCLALALSLTLSLKQKKTIATSLFRDLGHAIDTASLDRPLDKDPTRIFRVWHNLPIAYPYYIKSPLTRESAVDIEELRIEAMNREIDCGLRYFYFDVSMSQFDPMRPMFRGTSELKAWLDQFPSTSVPTLVTDIYHLRAISPIRIMDCRIYEIRP